jgi:hypothetical protein
MTIFLFFQQMKNLAQYKYRILRLESDDAANMLYVNGRLIHRSRDEIGEKSYSVCIHKKKITHKYLIENIFQEIHVHVLQHFCIYFTLKVAAASSLLPTAMMSHPAMLLLNNNVHRQVLM